MENKLLEIFEYANMLNEKQNKVYTKITYIADDSRRLEIDVISKRNLTYLEQCQIQMRGNLESKFKYIIEILKCYIEEGDNNE